LGRGYEVDVFQILEVVYVYPMSPLITSPFINHSKKISNPNQHDYSKIQLDRPHPQPAIQFCQKTIYKAISKTAPIITPKIPPWSF
jgi:hypothetical protein